MRGHLPLPLSLPCLCSLRTWALALVVLLSLTAVCRADTLVQVDDTNAQIVYDPPDSWLQVVGTFDFDGSHMFTQDPDATATFTFSGGSSISFLAPLFPFLITLTLTLDSAAPTTISLQDTASSVIGDPDQSAVETAESVSLWTMSGLDPTVVHTLVVGVGGEGMAVVDQMQFVIPDPLDSIDTSTSTLLPSSTSTTPIPTPTPTPTITPIPTLPLNTIPLNPITSSTTIPLSSPTASPSTSSSSKPAGLSTAIGIVCALAALLALGVGFWWWRRRRRERREREAEEAAAEAAARAEGGMGGGFGALAYSATTSTSGTEGGGRGGTPEMKEALGEGTGGAVLGRSRSARYRDIAAYLEFGNDASSGGKERISTGSSGTLPSASASATASGSSASGGVNGGARAAVGSATSTSTGKSGSANKSKPGRPSSRRKAPPLPPAEATRRKSETLGTIPEVHPRDGEDLSSVTGPNHAGGGGAGDRNSTSTFVREGGALARELGYGSLGRDLGRDGVLFASMGSKGRQAQPQPGSPSRGVNGVASPGSPLRTTTTAMGYSNGMQTRNGVEGKVMRPISGVTATTMTGAETTTSGRDGDVEALDGEAWTVRP